MFGVPVIGWIVSLFVAILLAAVSYRTILKKENYGKSWWWVPAILRGTGLFGLILLLFNPWWLNQQTIIEDPVVLVYSDVSASISKEDLSKWDTEIQKLGTGKDWQIEKFRFSDDVVLGDSSGGLDTYRTNLSSVIKHANAVASRSAVAGVVWMTDGIGNEGRDVQYEALAEGIPMIVVGAGNPKVQIDALIDVVQCNEEAFFGNRFLLEVSVKAKQFKSKRLMVKMKAVTTELEQTWTPLSTNDWRRFTFEITPSKLGIMPISLDVLGADGDVNLANNRKELFVKVVDDRKSVAIVYGAPHPDVSAMKSALESGGQFLVKSVAQSQFGIDADVIILHGYDFQSSAEMKQVEAWVADGKSIWIFATPQQNTLNLFKSLSINTTDVVSSGRSWQDAQAAWNQDYLGWPLNESEQRMFSQFPPVSVPMAKVKLIEGSEVMLYQRWAGIATQVPLMYHWQGNKGAFANFLGEGIWRWRMHEKSNTGEAKVFDAWVRRMVGLLALGNGSKKPFEIIMPETTIDLRDRTSVRVVCRDKSGMVDDRVERQLQCVDEKGVARTLNLNRTPGGWTANLTGLHVGAYELKGQCLAMKTNDSKRFVVVDQPRELLVTQANHDVLNQLTKRSNGSFLTMDSLAELNRVVSEKLELTPVMKKETKNMHWWDSVVWMLVIGLLFGGEWLSRRLLGKY